MTLQEQLDSGRSHHQAGRFGEAEKIYREILARQPDHADAVFLLAILVAQTGRLEPAVELFRQAARLKPNNAEAPLSLGNALRHLGRLDEAIAAYRQAVGIKPDLAMAHNNLGIVLAMAGQSEDAIACHRRAIQIKPDAAEMHGNLGTTLLKAGQLDEAIASYREAVRLKPEYATAYNNLGSVLKDKGRLDEAISACREAIRIKPDFAEAHNNLGIVLRANEQIDEAIASYRQSIRLKPASAEAHNNLGDALSKKGQVDEAIACYRQAIRLKPDYSEAYSNLGNALQSIRQFDEAIVCLREAVRLKPNSAEAYTNLGNVLADKRQLEEAIACLRQAIRLRPGLAEAHGNLGHTLRSAGRLDESAACYRDALRLKPDFADAYNGLGNALRDLGQLDEAIAAYRKAVEQNPDDTNAHSNLIFALNYHPGIDAEEILTEHRAWSDRHARPLMEEGVAYQNERAPERRLRIGYVSADFWRHSVAYFLNPLLENHNRRMFEIFCYANVERPDGMTERMKRSSDVWRDIVGLTDEVVANLVRSDGIDILVDLSGHTAGNRLRVFARRPAPVQVTYLGYANTTGMSAIDYRLTDALADPPGMTDHLNVEKLWRLPGCAWCYQPAEDVPDVQPRGDGSITFGCFNASPKINSKLVTIWAELLKRVPGSRLLLKSAAVREESSRQRILGQFAERGVAGERIEILGWAKHPNQHLVLYERVDVALDTYPYHGTTTTCEALWMGVPVVSLAGKSHVSRVGVSLLSCVGLPELIAQSAEEYISIAAELTANESRLKSLRATLRDRLKSSPLIDGQRFAAEVESAYRQMWRIWCAKGSA